MREIDRPPTAQQIRATRELARRRSVAELVARLWQRIARVRRDRPEQDGRAVLGVTVAELEELLADHERLRADAAPLLLDEDSPVEVRND